MSLVARLTGGINRTSINVKEIRRNPFNEFSINQDKVKALAWSIQQFGQLENAVVYADDTGDGKQFTLVGGEHRWLAITRLVENGAHDGTIFVNIIPKPADELTERRMIRDDNRQREKTFEDKLLEIKNAEQEYEYLCSIGKKPKGKKRDFVGAILGVSGKTIDNLKNKEKMLQEANAPKISENSEDTSAQKKKEEDFQLDDLKVSLEKIYQCRIRVTKNSIQFKCKDTDELNELFAELGIQKKLDENYV